MSVSTKETSQPADQGKDEAATETAQHLDQAIDEGLFAMHFQPIVDLRSQSIFAHEALCRPQGDYFRSPVDLISAAVEASRIGELGRLQRTAATEGCPESAIFLNLEPHEFDEPYLVRPDDPIFKHRQPVYLEITENVPLKYFAQCHSVLGELRKKGILLVIDDFGAGFSNLKYIADLAPDIVKLDRELIQGCHLGTSEFSLLKSITALCHHMDARVVAEGIETVEELEAVVAAGVDYGQGYLLARPAAEPPEINWPRSIAANESDSSPPPDSDGDAREDEVDLGTAAYVELQAEVVKLNELLVESEVARLALVKRLREQPDSKGGSDVSAPDSAPEASPAEPERPMRRPRARAKPATSARPERVREHPVLEPPTVFVRKEERRPVPWRRILMVALPVVLIGVVWALWSLVSSGSDIEPALPVAAEPVPVAPPAAQIAQPVETPTEKPEQAVSEPEPAVVPESEITEDPTPPTPEPAPVSASAELAAEIASQVDAWARAWSEQRVEDYLAAYSLDFRPDSGTSFRDWAKLRQERLKRPAWINVEVSDLEIFFADPTRARASFRQAYSSPGFSDEVVKILDLTLEDNEWRILAEQVEDLSE